MLNQAVLVGRIVNEPELKDTEKGKVANITIAVPRSFKNANGDYDTDFVDAVLWKGVAESTAEYCKKGDLVGIKGRIQSTKNEKGFNAIQIVAEKVTFLSTRKSMDEEEKDIKM